MADADIKELRVKIEMSYHLKLHALKLLRNKKMSAAVEEALELYFREVAGLDEGALTAPSRHPAQGAEGTDPDGSA